MFKNRRYLDIFLVSNSNRTKSLYESYHYEHVIIKISNMTLKVIKGHRRSLSYLKLILLKTLSG